MALYPPPQESEQSQYREAAVTRAQLDLIELVSRHALTELEWLQLLQQFQTRTLKLLVSRERSAKETHERG